MKSFRWVVWGGLVVFGVVLVTLLLDSQAKTPLGRTLSPLFSLLGKTTKSADRILSRSLPIGDIDEKTLSEGFKAYFEDIYTERSDYSDYVNQLVQDITQDFAKDFDYEVFVVEGYPNAFALPGGVLMITDQMLELLDSEAQLVSILGHEVGHVERGHCFDSARFEMMSRKFKTGALLGTIVDRLYTRLTRTSFSKTQETESDEYGYQTLIRLGYDPEEMSRAFSGLHKYYQRQGLDEKEPFNPFRDYKESHPPIELRVENFEQRAKRWKKRHGKAGYIGLENFQKKVTKSQKTFEE